MIFTCPFCQQAMFGEQAAKTRFCQRCCVFVDEVIYASRATKIEMAKMTRLLALSTQTRSAKAQADTWEKAAWR